MDQDQMELEFPPEYDACGRHSLAYTSSPTTSGGQVLVQGRATDRYSATAGVCACCHEVGRRVPTDNDERNVVYNDEEDHAMPGLWRERPDKVRHLFTRTSAY